MKNIKSYHDFQPINEEIGVKSIATILASLLLTFKSVEAEPVLLFYKPPYFHYTKDEQTHAMSVLDKDMIKIQSDLDKIKDNIDYSDEDLNDLIDRCIKFRIDVNKTDDEDWMVKSVHDVFEVANLLQSYIDDHKVDDKVVIDTLQALNNNIDMLKSGDYKNLNIDYKKLVKDYENLLKEKPVTDASMHPVRTMILFVLCVFLSLAVMVLAKYAIALHISGHSVNPFQKKRSRRDEW